VISSREVAGNAPTHKPGSLNGSGR